jgi:transposase-like protein
MVAMVVEESCSITQAAERFEVSAKTCGKWCRRYLADGELGLLDRSSAPKRSPNQTPPARVEAIAALRRLRFTGPEIAETLDMALSTVGQILNRLGMGKLGRLGLEPAQRYEWQHPGELIHIDIKKLGRIQGGAGNRSARPSAITTSRPSPTAMANVAGRSAGTTFTSPSMTARVWPTPKSWPTRKRLR